MKVQSASIDIFTRDSPRISSTAQPRFRPGGMQFFGLLKITTDDGIEGNAFLGQRPEADLKSLCGQVLNIVQRDLVGRDATDREWLWAQLRMYTFYGGMGPLAWSAIDVALWDIAGKAAGLPVYKLLGAQRHSVPVYASSPYYPEVEGYVEEVLRYKAAGFTAYKIHPAGVPVSRVKEIATRVREAVGDDFHLMVDTSLCYDYEQALQIGKCLQSLDYDWFEDPVRYGDFDAVDELARRLDIPIAVSDHPSFGLHEAAQMVRRGNGVRILRGDSMKEGITGLKKLCSMAEGFAMKLEVHSSLNSLMNIANLHVVLAVNNCDFFELIVPPDMLQHGMVEDITVGRDGGVQAPVKPGLGFEIDRELIRRRRVEELR
jgi:L-alanine-DL-glutamate epimerase-like enolase superfamily enzyme